MLSIKPYKKLLSKNNRIATIDHIKDYISVKRGNYNICTQAAKDYAVKSCMDNIESLKYGLENKLISGRPYTLSELYEQAIYAERAFTAGVHWAFQYVRKQK